VGKQHLSSHDTVIHDDAPDRAHLIAGPLILNDCCPADPGPSVLIK
jgi:hypothetical protein